jgi:oxygen-dependent protoporphyrinogen oxidase
MKARRVVVVGGGITGLTAAYRLLKAGRDRGGAPIAVTLIESRARLGGNIVTERRDGLVLDGGPDSFVVARPQASVLCKDLGLGDRLIPTTEKNRKVYIRRGGVLRPMPEGLVLAIPSRVMPLARSGLFSLPGLARMGLDLVLPRRDEREGDESVGHFIRRRLGSEALERLAEPLLGGIYAGNVDALSLRATFPQLLEMEREHRSLIRGAIAQKAARAAPPGKPAPSMFYSLLGGMGELVDALGRAVAEAGGTVRSGAEVEAIGTGGDGDERARLRVQVRGDAESIPADDVILCTPAFVAAAALDGLDRELAAVLLQIPYVSTATVIAGYARVDVPHPLDASGLIIPKGEKRGALAATFVTSKWVGRAPADMALIRIFVGGHRDPHALTQTDEELCALARRELDALLGVRARPHFARVFRYDRANAQPVIGHPERVKRIRSLAAAHPGLRLAGAAFDGVGIPDCVRQADEAAAAIAGSALTS